MQRGDISRVAQKSGVPYETVRRYVKGITRGTAKPTADAIEAAVAELEAERSGEKAPLSPRERAALGLPGWAEGLSDSQQMDAAHKLGLDAARAAVADERLSPGVRAAAKARVRKLEGGTGR